MSAQNERATPSAPEETDRQRIGGCPDLKTLSACECVNDWLGWFLVQAQGRLDLFLSIPGIGRYKPHGHLLLAIACFAKAERVLKPTFDQLEHISAQWLSKTDVYESKPDLSIHPQTIYVALIARCISVDNEAFRSSSLSSKRIIKDAFRVVEQVDPYSFGGATLFAYLCDHAHAKDGNCIVV